MYLVYIIDNLMAICVERNPKEIVRQVAAAKELDSAKVGEVFKPESPLISNCRRGLRCLLAGRLGTQRCRPALRTGKLSLAWTTCRWTRRGAATRASPSTVSKWVLFRDPGPYRDLFGILGP